MKRTASICLSMLLLVTCLYVPLGSTAAEASEATAAIAPASDAISYEAEGAGNTMTGNASIANCASCSGEKKVGGLYQGATLQFNDISVPASGSYQMTVYYISGDPRAADISVNGTEARHVDFAKTTDWNTVGSMEMTLTLTENNNTILFSDGGQYSPDIDRIVLTPVNQGYEAEAAVNIMTGKAAVADCGSCSGGKKVGNLYQGSSLQFQTIEVPAAGSYKMTVFYISGDPRSAEVSVNGGPSQSVLFGSTTDWNTVGSQTVNVSLQAGTNSILFADGGGYSPDIDKISLSVDNGNDVPLCEQSSTTSSEKGALLSQDTFGSIQIMQYTGSVVIKNGDYAVTYDTDKGMADYSRHGKLIARGIYSKSSDSASSCYANHSFSMKDVKPVKDGFGKGITLKFVNTQDGSPTLNQWYTFYNDQPYFLTRSQTVSETVMKSNYMAPLVTNTIGGIDIGSYTDGRVLSVPYDNDMWIRYQAVPINSSDTSYEVSAVYDNITRNGLIIGSVTHDTWKTGIHFTGDNNRLNKLEVFGGVSSTKTHDSLAHGSISGTSLWSPQVFVGFFDDYRTGMVEYGKANAVIAPPLDFGPGVPKEVPVGWNSWAAFGSKLTFQDVLDTSDYLKNNLQRKGFNNHQVTYLNLDSYWDNLSDEQLAQVVAATKRNGQKAGIYWGPFVYWGDNMDQNVEGSSTYKYGDILLKDEAGNLLPKVDGAYAVDPSHPGAKERMAYYLTKFKKLGFEYIKLDFLTHGALEGKHYDPAVQTGTQAYNMGMAYVDSLIADQMFISESIAPMFPSQYAHSRRIATDTFGSISDTEFQLNALTYGWWQNGTIYHFTDPDHMALTRANSLTEAQSRVNAAAITGTVFLNSDDMHDTRAQQYMTTLLTNQNVLDVAKLGKAFQAIEGNTGSRAADAFVLKDKGTTYIAVFNYGNTATLKTISLERAGLNGSSTYKMKDLWTGESSELQGSLEVSLEPMESKLIRIS